MSVWRGSWYVAPAGLILNVFLPQPPPYWDYRHLLPCYCRRILLKKYMILFIPFFFKSALTFSQLGLLQKSQLWMQMNLPHVPIGTYSHALWSALNGQSWHHTRSSACTPPALLVAFFQTEFSKVEMNLRNGLFHVWFLLFHLTILRSYHPVSTPCLNLSEKGIKY